jgi:hypothetical protein
MQRFGENTELAVSQQLSKIWDCQHNLKSEREAAEVWAAEKGLTIDESITDFGISGFRGENRINRALSRFLERHL